MEDKLREKWIESVCDLMQRHWSKKVHLSLKRMEKKKKKYRDRSSMREGEYAQTMKSPGL